MSFILSIDQGTTGTTSMLIDSKTLLLVDKINQEHPQHYPHPGEVEHDLNDIWKSVEQTVKKLLEKNSVLPSTIDALGITNQRETTCAFNRKGEPLAKAIVWQDRRTHSFCQELSQKNESASIRHKTGLTIDPYFSATKMNWLLKNNEEVIRANKSDDLLFGTIDTFLLYKLTGATTHLTDITNASRTLLMNLESSAWDDELLSIFNVPLKTLPRIAPSFSLFGKTKGLSFLPDGIPIACLLGDQQSALFGQAGFHLGDVKCTYGTGSFILMNTGKKIVRSSSGLLTTVAYGHGTDVYYALEGSCYVTGAAVQWLRDNLKIIKLSSEIEALANQVTRLSEMEHVLFLPFFTGIGSPHWKAEARAAIVGLTRDTSNSHLARACLDGIALSINDLIGAMQKDSGEKLTSLRVDGGAVVNNTLMEIQATVSNLKIIRPKVIETTGYGSALGAAIGSGMAQMDQLAKLWKEERSFDPKKEWVSFYETKRANWKQNIKRLYF